MIENNGGDIPTSAEQRALEIMCYQFWSLSRRNCWFQMEHFRQTFRVFGEKAGLTWYGDYHFNINVQMNYCYTMASNLSGMCETIQ